MSVEAIAGFTAAGATVLGVAFGAFYWLFSMIRSESRAARAEAREDNTRLREELREDNAQLREDNTRLREDNDRLRRELLTEVREGNQRILEAFYRHRHDSDGTVAL